MRASITSVGILSLATAAQASQLPAWDRDKELARATNVTTLDKEPPKTSPLSQNIVGLEQLYCSRSYFTPQQFNLLQRELRNLGPLAASKPSLIDTLSNNGFMIITAPIGRYPTNDLSVLRNLQDDSPNGPKARLEKMLAEMGLSKKVEVTYDTHLLTDQSGTSELYLRCIVTGNREALPKLDEKGLPTLEHLRTMSALELLDRAVTCFSPYQHPSSLISENIKQGLVIAREKTDDPALKAIIDLYSVCPQRTQISGTVDALPFSTVKAIDKIIGKVAPSDMKHLLEITSYRNWIANRVQPLDPIDNIYALRGELLEQRAARTMDGDNRHTRMPPEQLLSKDSQRLLDAYAATSDKAYQGELLIRSEVILSLLINSAAEKINLIPLAERNPTTIMGALQEVVDSHFSSEIVNIENLLEALATHQGDCDIRSITMALMGNELGYPIKLAAFGGYTKQDPEMFIGHCIAVWPGEPPILWETNSEIEPGRRIYESQEEAEKSLKSITQKIEKFVHFELSDIFGKTEPAK